MANPVNPPRGMRDFLPADKARRERFLRVIRDTYRSHGFDEIETPAVEDHARLHSGLGGDNEKLAFGILKRGLSAEDLSAVGDLTELTDLGLRFDLTVPLARFYASHRAELPAVFRSIQIGPVWRAERPQKGRYRQFVQCDIDIIGEPGPLAEIELITATHAALDALGVTQCTIRINDRRILTGMLTSFGVPEAQHGAALISIDKLDKIGADGVAAELAEQGIEAPGFAETVTTAGWSLADSPPRWLDVDVYRELLAIRDAVPEITLVFDPTLVRGMGYYTGTIFEVAHPELGYSLGGGGRYDGMIGRFLGTPVPAIGFSLGFERLVDLVEEGTAASATAVAVLHGPEASPAQLMLLKQSLQRSADRVRLELAMKNKKAQFAALAAAGFTHIAYADELSTPDSLELRPLS